MGEAAKQAPARSRRAEEEDPQGRHARIAHIKATFNNTIVTITTPTARRSRGRRGEGRYFKGARKSTPYAAGRAAENAAQVARKAGMVEVEVKVKGPGAGREQAILNLQNAGLKVTGIEDVTPVCRTTAAVPRRSAACNEALRVACDARAMT
jgi:small subunit ribosomal protein S11